jgi:hypothetical protein
MFACYLNMADGCNLPASRIYSSLREFWDSQKVNMPPNLSLYGGCSAVNNVLEHYPAHLGDKTNVCTISENM